MRRLLFKDVQQFTALQQSLAAAFALYNDRAPELNASLLGLLDDAVSVYRGMGRQDKECQILSLKAELLTAARSINPATLEKVTLRRHEMHGAIAFKVLQAIEVQFRMDLQEPADSLRQAEVLLSQIVLAAIQKGLISDAAIRETTTPAAIEVLWAAIAADADIALAEKRVLLMVSAYDAFLLIDGLLAGLR